MSTDRKPHRFADIFPMLDDAELQEMATDINKNDLQEPIVIYNDEILDGRNRYAACKIAGVTPKLRKFIGTDEEALQFVESHNLHRRHLTASQRAMVAARMADLRVVPDEPVPEAVTPGEPAANEAAPEKPRNKPRKKKTTIDAAAKIMKVSPASVKKAKELQKKDPVKSNAVDKGEKSLDAAHQEMRTETGKSGAENIAVKLGNTAIATLGRIPKDFKKSIFERVRIWIDVNIDL